MFNGYNDLTTFPMNWWFFVRGGTYVIYNNALPALQSTDYGTKPDVNMTVMNLQRNAGPIRAGEQERLGVRITILLTKSAWDTLQAVGTMAWEEILIR